MRGQFGIKFATLVFVVLATAAPVFAAPAPRDDSPFGGIERAIGRIIHQVKKIVANGDILCVPK